MLALLKPTKLKQPPNIIVFEHDRLSIKDGHDDFKKSHLDTLLKLNELHGFKYFDIVRDGIIFKHYVGVIQVGDLTIEILPKADDRETKEGTWRDVLIQMLKACNKLKVSTYGDANVKRQNMDLLEIYFATFLSELRGLIKQGLVKKYRTECSNVTALKGKLIFSKNIRYNLVHQERFFTAHQVYDKDHELHQILGTALNVVEQFTRGTHLHGECKRVLLDFPETTEIRITKKRLDQFEIHRKTKAYTRAFEIARLILLNYSPDISAGNEKMLALLFDMNKLWEEYVIVKMREALSDSDYKLMAKDYKPFWGSNSLEPDIVIEHDQQVTVIDTKWKTPGEYSASVQDLRQMYAYNRFWNSYKAVLLYPGDPRTTDFVEFENDNEVIKHKCKMAFVSVLNDKDELDEEVGRKILEEVGISIGIKVT